MAKFLAIVFFKKTFPLKMMKDNDNILILFSGNGVRSLSLFKEIHTITNSGSSM